MNEEINNLLILKPLKKLEHSQDLCIEIPQNFQNFTSKKYILGEIESISEKYKCINFHYIQEINNIKLSILIQLIDTKNIRKKENFLNPHVSKVGISIGKFQNNLYSYFNFA